MQRTNITLVAIASVFLFLTTISALRADIVISFADASVNAGGSASIDVFISSNSATGDNINLFSTMFEISAATSGTGVAEFLPSANQFDTERAEANYVFASALDANGFSSERQDPIKTQLVQSDFTLNFADTNITGARLLARLEFQQLANAATGTFQISLKNDGAKTFFLNSAGNAVGISLVSFSNFGTITSVPEPTSCLLCCLGIAVLAVGRSRTKKNK